MWPAGLKSRLTDTKRARPSQPTGFRESPIFGARRHSADRKGILNLRRLQWRVRLMFAELPCRCPRPRRRETASPFRFATKNSTKGFIWVWMERVAPKKPRVPQPDVIAVRVASLDNKDSMLALDPTKFFTEPHYNGFPAVLVNLPAVTVGELKPLTAEAWRCQAPKDLDLKKKPRVKRERSQGITCDQGFSEGRTFYDLEPK